MSADGRATVGVDLDHTLICYDTVLPAIVRAMGHGAVLDRLESQPSKRSIRDALRALDDGERLWQRVQARLYGPGLEHAAPYPGALERLARWRREGVEVHIVSHKTRRPRRDSSIDLHAAALAWLERHGVVGSGSRGVEPVHVHFLATRSDKVRRIAALACRLFVDDLVETFEHPDFPRATRAVLFVPSAERSDRSAATVDLVVVDSWRDARLELPRTRPPDEPLGGRNSRVVARTLAWPIDATKGGCGESVTEIVVKRYAAPRPDRLDPQQVEAEALRHMARAGLADRLVPRLLAVDPARRESTMTRLRGMPWTAAQVATECTTTDVDALLGFLAMLDETSDDTAAARLPRASEAVLCLADLERHQARRLAALRAISPTDEDEPQAQEATKALAEFLDVSLQPARRRFAVAAAARLARVGVATDRPLTTRRRRLTPSDVGFHNALRSERGDGTATWRFVDFEYFGWDDPAKTLADLLLHPRLPLPPSLRRRLVERRLRSLAGDTTLGPRLEALYRPLGIQWCLILLNDYLPTERERQVQLAALCNDQAPNEPSAEPAATDPRLRQLRKARALLRHLETATTLDEFLDAPPRFDD
ncbi:MAG: hypothetical protein AAGC60_22800 [Acidobacteriota bacterium]